MRAQSTPLGTKVFSHIQETGPSTDRSPQEGAPPAEVAEVVPSPWGRTRNATHADHREPRQTPSGAPVTNELGDEVALLCAQTAVLVGGRERSQPRSQGLTAALPWPRPQSLPSVAVIRLVIPVRVPPALQHEGTAAQTMELGRASATSRRPLPRRGGALPQPLGGARREPSGDSWRACWPSVS